MKRKAFQNMLTVGVEDGSFQKGVTREAFLAIVLLKQANIENVKIIKITVDGLDATEKLAKILKNWKFGVLLLAGISYAGFNIINPMIIYEKFRKPVIIITLTKPNNKAVKRALKRHFEDWETRWKVFQGLGPIHKITIKSGEAPLYMETVGAHAKLASSLIRSLCFCGRIPEPLRAARLIARGLS
ncbi:MAG: endonuclease dU [Candidatus Bathycorpusculaceae bacterium]